MVNFGYPYNDLVICKDSTDYLVKKVRACADRLLSFVTKVTFVFVNIIHRLVDFRTHFKLEVVV